MGRLGTSALLLGLLAVGCDGSGITTVNHVRPQSAHDYTFSGWLGSYDHFEVEGGPFGVEPGTLRLGGEPVVVDSWSDHWIRATLPPNVTSGALEVERADGEVLTGPDLLINQGDNPIETVFAEYLTEHSQEAGLGAQWLAWATDPTPPVAGDTRTNLSFYAAAYQRAVIEQGTITVAYHYHDGIPYPRHQDYEFDVDTTSLSDEEFESLQELAHMSALEAWFEAAFPGLTFEFRFEGDMYSADMVVWANVPPEVLDPASGTANAGGYEQNADQFVPTVRAVHEGVLAHEIGHILGLAHHYTNSGQGNGQFMPPGETACIMNQEGNAWCSGCAAALMIGEQDAVASAALLEEVRTYIDDG